MTLEDQPERLPQPQRALQNQPELLSRKKVQAPPAPPAQSAWPWARSKAPARAAGTTATPKPAAPGESLTDTINRRFEAAAATVKRESTGVSAARAAMSKDDKLRLYGLYKQATAGDAPDKAPSIFDFAAREKWAAWRAHAGREPLACKQSYVTMVEKAQGSRFA